MIVTATGKERVLDLRQNMNTEYRYFYFRVSVIVEIPCRHFYRARRRQNSRSAVGISIPSVNVREL